MKQLLLLLICCAVSTLTPNIEAFAETLCVRSGSLRIFSRSCPRGWKIFPVKILGNVVGAQGVQGAQGEAGPVGPTGSQGQAGATGPQGIPGVGPRGETNAPIEVTLDETKKCQEIDLETLCADGNGCVFRVVGQYGEKFGEETVNSPDIYEAVVMLATPNADGSITAVARDLSPAFFEAPNRFISALGSGDEKNNTSVYEQYMTVYSIQSNAPMHIIVSNYRPGFCTDSVDAAYSVADRYKVTVRMELNRTLVNPTVTFSVFDK